MKTTVRIFEMNHPNESGTLHDVVRLYKWLGEIDFSSIQHRFTIEVKIVETKEVE